MCDICRICKLGKENILSALYHLSGNFRCAAHCCLPEWHIKYVMQTKRNQCTLDQSEDQSSHIAGTGHKTAQRIDTVLYGRPDEIHQNADKHVYNCGNNRYKPCASKE